MPNAGTGYVDFSMRSFSLLCLSSILAILMMLTMFAMLTLPPHGWKNHSDFDKRSNAQRIAEIMGDLELLLIWDFEVARTSWLNICGSMIVTNVGTGLDTLGNKKPDLSGGHKQKLDHRQAL